MELMEPAEEIFEVNSNSTTDTLKEQRLARNKELRLKATYLVSRRQIKKNQQKDYNSESSSEFPASSPSNPQMQRNSQYQSRPPMLKNTLPADAFERGLALIATKQPQMTMSEKIESWQCVSDGLSDVEDVVNFDAAFEQREGKTYKQLSKRKFDLKTKNNKSQKDRNSTAANNHQIANVDAMCCYSFTEFQRRLLAIDARKANLPGIIEQKNNSKFTSEEDEKPTTSNNYLARNRDAPLKKRPCKYKRAAEPIAHLPNKKSSSSDTPRDAGGAPPSAKKKVQQQKVFGVVGGEGVHVLNDKMLCLSSSETSSHIVKTTNNINAAAAGGSSSNVVVQNSRLHMQAKSKQQQQHSKLVENESINYKWNRTNSIKYDERESFFKWRRLSREIDKNKINDHLETTNDQQQQRPIQIISPPTTKENKGLIQIRYDFLEPKNHQKISETIASNINAYNIVVKPLKKEKLPKVIPSNNLQTTNLANDQNRPSSIILQTLCCNSEEPIIKTDDDDNLKENELVSADTKMEMEQEAAEECGTEFHQQHEFCNYLGLTGMSTANAMANAAAELSKCYLARRSLRVRHLEQRKAKSKNQSEASKQSIERNFKEKQSKSSSSIATEEKKISEPNFVEESKSSSLKQILVNPKKEIEESNESKQSPSIMSKESNKKIDEKKIDLNKEAKIKILCQINSNLEDNKKEGNLQYGVDTTTTMNHRRVEEGIPNSLKSNSSRDKISNLKNDIDDLKYIDLHRLTSNRNENSVKTMEIQSLHEKVQKCLEESRQNAPNIFIVKCFDSTLENEKNPAETESIKMLNTSDTNTNNQYETAKMIRMPNSCSSATTSKTSIQCCSNKGGRQVNNTMTQQNSKDIKRKTIKSNIKKNKMLSNRKFYTTRSMLNLNQQRELRNRKVILKILKTYSGLKIKVSKSKSKQQTIDKKQNKKAKNNNSEREEEEEILSDTKDWLSQKSGGGGGGVAVTCNESKINEEESIAAVFINPPEDSPIENVIKLKTEHEMPPTSNKKIMSEVAVQTEDPLLSPVAPVPRIVKLGAAAAKLLSPNQIQDATIKFNCVNAGGEIDISSSDVVTSTTSGVWCDQNRCDPRKTSLNLVTREEIIFEHFPVDDEHIVDVKDNDTIMIAPNPPNPIINISISSSINDMGIHALNDPKRALRNPLQDSNGSVLYIFFEFDILIVVQESMISFWKYLRVLNALMIGGSGDDDINIDDIDCKTNKFTEHSNSSNNNNNREIPLHSDTIQSLRNLRNSKIDGITSPFANGNEWIYLGERKRLCSDIEIGSPYMNRLCLSDSRPVYIEMRCRELSNEFRECNLLSCYVNVYYFNEEDQSAYCHSIQLDSIQSTPSEIIYTTINESRYFVLAWPQANVLGKVRSGLCKYAMTPELDMLATTRDFKAMRHVLRSLECLSDGKLLGFGDTQLTVWDHRSGDILMNYDLSLTFGRNLGSIYYPCLENGQSNVIILIQHIKNETSSSSSSSSSSELLFIACTVSHTNPSRRVLQRYKLPTPAFSNIRNGVNNGEQFIIQSETGEEIIISCNDPHRLIFVPSQQPSMRRFYTRGRTQVIELTKSTLTVENLSSHLLKIAADLNTHKNQINFCV